MKFLTHIHINLLSLVVLLLVSSTALGQFDICMGSTHKYGVDMNENGGNGSTGSTYTWQVNTPFEGTITPLTPSGNAVEIFWGNSPVGTYTLTVIEDTNGCTNTTTTQVIVRNTMDLDDLPSKYICEIGDSVNLAGPTGFDSYTWLNENNQTIGETQNITVSEPGIYTLIVEKDNCSSSLQVEVLPVEFPTFTVSTNQFGSIIVNYQGGNVEVEFQLEALSGDQVIRPWQTSNEFHNLKEGLYLIRIRTWDATCDAFVFGSTVNIPNAITPNGDGYNDIWDLSKLNTYAPNAKIEIYDRYGKLFKIITKKDNFKWDGTYLGRPLPSTSYFYILYFDENNKTTGTLLIKNY